MKTTALFPVILLLAACSTPVPDSAPLEPIVEDNIYDPNAAVIEPADPITSGPITSGPISSAPLSDKERLVAAMEANGCALNPENSERILTELGIPQDRMTAIGSELMQEGRVAVVPPAEFRLITGACAT